ncbi:MAG: hypothetical protein [Myoviridae sp. ctThM1]|nr:MAG: hypothetical protein [Myoviridae sp. ctThM1]
MSKISMKAGGFQKWFATVIASSDNEGFGKDSKFNKLIEAEGWNPDDIEVKISLNGVEFSNLDDFFSRVDQHIENESHRLAEVDASNQKKLEAIREVLNSGYEDD